MGNGDWGIKEHIVFFVIMMIMTLGLWIVIRYIIGIVAYWAYSHWTGKVFVAACLVGMVAVPWYHADEIWGPGSERRQREWWQDGPRGRELCTRFGPEYVYCRRLP